MTTVALSLLLLALAAAHMLVGAAVPSYALPVYTVCGLAALAGALGGLGRRPLPLLVPVVSAGLFAVYIAARAWLSPVEYLARPDLTGVAAALAVYLLVALLFTPAPWRLAIVWGVIALGLGSTAIGFVQFLRVNNWMPFGFERADYGARASGFYICPNHTAGFLEIAAMFALALACFGRFRVTMRIFVGYLGLLLLAGIAITGSRGGYLSTLCGFATLAAVTLVLVGRRRPGMLLAVFASVAILSAALWWGAPVLMRKHTTLSSRLDRIVDTRNNRIEMWQAALDQHRQAPVFGTGAGSYLYFGRYFRPEGGYKEDPIHTHGDYLELLGEYGIVGATLGLLLLLGHAFAGLRSALGVQLRRLREGSLSSSSLALTVGALAALATQAAHAVVDFNLHIPANALVVAAVLGMLANPGIASSNTTGSRRARVRRTLLAVVGIAAIAASARYVVPEWFHEKARVAMAQERWADAATEAKRGLRHDPRNPELHGILGEARLYRSADVSGEAVARLLLEGARNDLERALQLFPGDVWRWIALGQTLDSLERYGEARVAYDEAIRNSPTWGQGYGFLGLHFERQGLAEEAMEMYQQAGRLGNREMGSAGEQRIRVQLRNPRPPQPVPEP